MNKIHSISLSALFVVGVVDSVIMESLPEYTNYTTADCSPSLLKSRDNDKPQCSLGELITLASTSRPVVRLERLQIDSGSLNQWCPVRIKVEPVDVMETGILHPSGKNAYVHALTAMMIDFPFNHLFIYILSKPCHVDRLESVSHQF